MQTVFSYLCNMLPYIAITTPVYLLCRFLFLKKKKLPTTGKREFLLCLFVMLMAGLLSQTVIPKIEISVTGLSILNEGRHSNNFIPFKIFADTYQQFTSFQNGTYFLINFLGNLLLFVPVGFLLKLLWKWKDWVVIMVGFSISFGIEFTQLFLPRNTDVDDLILNTAGAALGVLAYKLFVKYMASRTH